MKSNLVLTFGSEAGVKIMFTLQLYNFIDYRLDYSLLNKIQAIQWIERPASFHLEHAASKEVKSHFKSIENTW